MSTTTPDSPARSTPATRLARLTRTETKLFLREPAGVFFALVFPALLLVIIGSVPAFREPSADFGGQRFIDQYLPVMVAMSLAMLSLNGLPSVLAAYRERGILRRMATTPVGPVAVLGAQLITCVLLAAGTTVLLLAVGRVAFGVALPTQIPGYLLAFVLGAGAMLAIGLVVAALAPNGRAAGTIGSLLFFPILFFAGLWIPRAVMPPALRAISDFSPLGAAVQSLQDAAAGVFPQVTHLLVLVGWIAAAGAAAARFFRWE